MAWSDMGIRSVTAAGLISLLVGSSVLAYWTQGLDAAVAALGLYEGLILAAVGFLWGSHMSDEARKAAASAEAGKSIIRKGATEAETSLAVLERDLQLARTALAKAIEVPEAREKVNEVLRDIEDE